jgi:hypothetical protein
LYQRYDSNAQANPITPNAAPINSPLINKTADRIKKPAAKNSLAFTADPSVTDDSSI